MCVSVYAREPWIQPWAELTLRSTVHRSGEKETKQRHKALSEKILLLSEIAVMKLLTPELYCSFSQHRQFEPLNGSHTPLS